MSLEFFEINPQKGKPLGCVIGLHGLGANGKDLMPLAEQLNLPQTKFIFPNGPFPVEYSYEGRAWYQLPRENGRGIPVSRKKLIELVQQIESSGIPAREIMIAGFSQGAVMSLDAGLRYPNKLCGLMALSGYLHAPERLSEEKSSENKGLPVLVCHGVEDDVLPVQGSREAALVLEKEGYSVAYHEFPIGHQIVPEELRIIRQFILTSLHRSLFPS
ncbi:MAG: alpha/beta hydrolase [Nitrospirae bacterium]|nr:alpha/beta hydrolase [Nitrospirota bacterium]MBI3351956.1 alpha/beta hydrolase [Nitrospirota bacterium]